MPLAGYVNTAYSAKSTTDEEEEDRRQSGRLPQAGVAASRARLDLGRQVPGGVGDKSSVIASKCFLGVHAAWLSSSLTTGCGSGANGLPICDSTLAAGIVR